MSSRMIAAVFAAAGVLFGVPALATAPPAGGLIAYDQPSKGGYRLVIAGPNQPTRLLRRVPAWALTPRWSPDGRWIAFSGCWSDTCQIYVVHPDGSGLRRVTHDPTGLFTPAWMPNGQVLLAGRHVRETDEGVLAGAIVTVQLSSGTEHVVVTGDQELLYPTWSRATGTIVFSASSVISPYYGLLFQVPETQFLLYWEINTSRIESVRLDGSGFRPLLALGRDPAVSPDGRQVAYAGGATELGGATNDGTQLPGGLNQVHVMGINGDGDHVVGQFGFSAFNPTWSPDSRSLLVTAADLPYGLDQHIVRLYLKTGRHLDLSRPGGGGVFADEQPTR
jgi:Tol biopolymer transport system component